MELLVAQIRSDSSESYGTAEKEIAAGLEPEMSVALDGLTARETAWLALRTALALWT